MSKSFLTALAIGIGCVAVIVAGITFMQRGARVGLAGRVLKVRTAPLDEKSSVAVLDFRLTNPSDVLFVVRSVTVLMDDPDGKQYEGQTASEVDARRLFEAVPLLDKKYNDTLVVREKIASHASADRMVAARFEAPESRLEARKRFVVRVEEVDGAVSEFVEAK